MNLTTVRNGLVTRLKTITGLTATNGPPITLEPPHAYINNIVSVTPAQTFDGLAVIEFEVIVLVSRADEDTGWDVISGYCGTGTGSIYNALNVDDDFANTIQFTDGGKFENVGEILPYDGANYLGFTARITVNSL